MGLWAGIKYALNSTLGTDGFQPLDKLIFKGFYPDTELNYEGSDIQYVTTIKIPKYTKRAVITACAGGGAGGPSQTYNAGRYGGNGGGGGGFVYKESFPVTEDMWDTVISITIGSGGVAASARPDGAATTVGNFVTLLGGTGGALGGNISSFSTTGGSPNGGDGGQCIGTGEANFKLAQDTAHATGGGLGARKTGTPVSVTNSNATRYGGGGGASLGNGGNGGTYSTVSSSAGTADCPGEAGEKGGGGGGGAQNSAYVAQQYVGGNGGNGYVKIEWELF